VEFGADGLESLSQRGPVDAEANPAVRHAATVCEKRSCVGQALKRADAQDLKVENAEVDDARVV
jgi:hypothetical protein